MIQTTAMKSQLNASYPPFGLAGISTETFQRWLGQAPSINPNNRPVTAHAVPADFGGDLSSAMQNVMMVLNRWIAGENASPLHTQQRKNTWLA